MKREGLYIFDHSSTRLDLRKWDYCGHSRESKPICINIPKSDIDKRNATCHRFKVKFQYNSAISRNDGLELLPPKLPTFLCEDR